MTMTGYTQKWECPICMRIIETIGYPREAYPCGICINDDETYKSATIALREAQRAVNDAQHQVVLYAEECSKANELMVQRGFKWVRDPSNARTGSNAGEWVKS